MPREVVDLTNLESLRETGDYDKIASSLPDDWPALQDWADEAIRLLVRGAEIAGRGGRVEEMEIALAPYLDDFDRVPLGLADRVMLTVAVYRYRRHEPTETLRLARSARTIAGAREDEFMVGRSEERRVGKEGRSRGSPDH